MNTFHRISRRFLVLLLTFSLVLGCAVPALAEPEDAAPAEVQEAAPAAVVTPEPAAEVVPEPAAEVVPEPAAEVVPEPVVEVKTDDSVAPAEIAAVEAEISEEPEEIAEEEAVEEEVPELYFWVDPITLAVYSELTYNDCMAVIGEWVKNNPDKLLTNAIPTPMGALAPEPGYILLTAEAEAEEAPAESIASGTDAEEAVPAETKASTYGVEFTLNGKEAKFESNEAVTLAQLLTALGIEIPEGAQIALDESTVDTEHLTWSEKDGEMVLSFDKGAFTSAGALVVYIDGVATEIQVTDGMSPKDAKDEVAKQIAAATGSTVKMTGTITIDHAGSEVIDLGGKTLKFSDEYAFVVGSEEADKVVELSVMNGVIEAAENAVKVIGNTIVNFINVTIKAAKNVLNIGSEPVENAGALVTVDKKSSLRSEGKDGADTVTVTGATNTTGNANNVLIVEGAVKNTGGAYAIGAGSSVDNLDVMLMPTAKLSAVSGHAVMDPKLKNSVINLGASVSSSKGLSDFGQTVFDLNYDTNNRKHAISWGSYDSADLAEMFTPTRPGMSFVTWNTKPDGTGTNYTMKKALEKEISRVYAIWGPVDYHWLIAATAKYNGYEVYAATRMSVKDGVADVTFEDSAKRELDIVRVAVKDLKNLENRKIKTLRIFLSDDLVVELDMATLKECVGIDAKGKAYNTADIYNEDGIITTVAGKTALFNLETSKLQADTKNAITASYGADGLNILYGKDKMFHVNAANLGANVVLVLKGSKLASQSVDGLDVTRYKDTREALSKGAASGNAVAEAAKLK